MNRWRKAYPDAKAQLLLTMADQMDLQKGHQQDEREIKPLQQKLRRKDKALAEAEALLTAFKRIQAYGEWMRRIDRLRGSAEDPEETAGHRAEDLAAPAPIVRG